MASHARRIAAATGTLLAALALLGAQGAAADNPVFPVMNTDEQPPDGVWFRYAPDPNMTERVTGLGVYKGEHVSVKCYWNGTAFGPYNNTVWYYAYDVERPTVMGRSNEGWINTHYVADSMTAGNAAPGVPACASGSGNGGDVDGGGGTSGSGGGGTTVAVPSPANVYFAPYSMSENDRFAVNDPAVDNVRYDDWDYNCSWPGRAWNAAKAKLAAGQAIKTLSGWSWGRVGAISYLKTATVDELQSINYVLLIDPGDYGDLSKCDKFLGAGGVLATWLQTNRNAHLVVLSTSAISQRDHSRGIQEVYFNTIRNRSSSSAPIRNRVLTCNYNLPSDRGVTAHQRALLTGKYWINHEIGPSTTSCPRLAETGRTFSPTSGWHP